MQATNTLKIILMSSDVCSILLHGICVQNVDVAADEALRKHLRGRGQYDDSPLWISPALDGIASSGGEEQDAVTEGKVNHSP